MLRDHLGAAEDAVVDVTAIDRACLTAGRAALWGAPRVLLHDRRASGFLDGLPDADRDDVLGRLGKNHMFIWAWGVNGCFSVIGAAAAPVIATNFGLGAVIEIAGFAYLIALPAFFGVIAVDKSAAQLETMRPRYSAASSPSRNITVLQRIDDERLPVAEHKNSMIVKTLLIKCASTVRRGGIRTG